MNEGNVLCMPRADFLYRDTESIREDISEIRHKIGEVKESFSIREVLLDMLSDNKVRRPSDWIYELEALLSEAEIAYSRLTELREELCYLEEELRQTRCRMGM